MTIRRIAAPLVRSPKGNLEQAIVVLTDGVVSKVYPFTAEEASTEWYSGVITLREDSEGRLTAWTDNMPIR